MTIEELEDKCSELLQIETFKNTKWETTCILDLKEHIKLSIEFAVSVLEECINYVNKPIENSCQDNVEDKIQELKQYLDEKNNSYTV